jgi:hypothetical protein
MKSSKTLLALGSDALHPVLQDLHQQHWHITHLHDVQQLKPRQAGPFSAGLLLLDNKLQRKLDMLQQLGSQLDMEWVLLTDRQQLEHPAVRSFINDSCYDYHCLPVESARLAVTLGRLHGKTSLRGICNKKKRLQKASSWWANMPAYGVCVRKSADWRVSMSLSSLPASPAAAKSWWPGCSINTQTGPMAPSRRSTAVVCRSIWCSRNCSATSAARLPGVFRPDRPYRGGP